MHYWITSIWEVHLVFTLMTSIWQQYLCSDFPTLVLSRSVNSDQVLPLPIVFFVFFWHFSFVLSPIVICSLSSNKIWGHGDCWCARNQGDLGSSTSIFHLILWWPGFLVSNQLIDKQEFQEAGCVLVLHVLILFAVLQNKWRQNISNWVLLSLSIGSLKYQDLYV